MTKSITSPQNQKSQRRFAPMVIAEGEIVDRFQLKTVIVFMKIRRQIRSATITGTVTDTSGSLIPRAQVTVTEQENAISCKTVTTESGAFTVPYLPAGTYTATFTAPGFAEYKVMGIVLTIGQWKFAERSDVVEPMELWNGNPSRLQSLILAKLLLKVSDHLRVASPNPDRAFIRASIDSSQGIPEPEPRKLDYVRSRCVSVTFQGPLLWRGKIRAMATSARSWHSSPDPSLHPQTRLCAPST